VLVYIVCVAAVTLGVGALIFRRMEPELAVVL
jgi:hypothetical protein